MDTTIVQYVIPDPEKLYEKFREILREELLASSQPKKSGPRYLTRKEAKELLKISYVTIDDYTRKGIIKGSKIGSRILYLESNILEAVKDIPVRKYQRK